MRRGSWNWRVVVNALLFSALAVLWGVKERAIQDALEEWRVLGSVREEAADLRAERASLDPEGAATGREELTSLEERLSRLEQRERASEEVIERARSRMRWVKWLGVALLACLLFVNWLFRRSRAGTCHFASGEGSGPGLGGREG
jgi:uncharacterized membrane protein